MRIPFKNLHPQNQKFGSLILTYRLPIQKANVRPKDKNKTIKKRKTLYEYLFMEGQHSVLLIRQKRIE
ncbi:hypothetical protein CON53_27020 [Bacillus cereus]|nr:hypothetical protein CON53_27020 [Bacillus cereus]PFH80348.1 hypothetical protein COI81_29975 [Bacillus cereus]PFM45712.1 hypothetical protein COJ52_30575 [Bacillus cereus]PFR99914.1 hypothetical protein COK55_32270 [Bacillus cereus]PGS27183.1 hypothetical protein COC55_11400 [Bacillus cereus]